MNSIVKNILPKYLSFLIVSILFELPQIQGQALPFAAEISAFQKEDSLHPKKIGQIVFVGSSTFTLWKDVQIRFPDFKIINRGFGGSSLGDVFKHASATIYRYQPKQVFIYCGENDFASDTTLPSREVFNRYLNLVREIRYNLPQAEILYISAKPSPSRWHLESKFREFNTMVREYSSKQPGFGFVNIWDAMLGEDGKPKENIFLDDKLHMNKAGYEIWIPILKAYMN